MSNIVTQRFVKCHHKLKEDKVIKSSRQFAMNLDYLPQSLSEILKGRRDATIELIRKAVEVYNLNPTFLFTGDGPMFVRANEDHSLRVLTVVTNHDEDAQIVYVPIPAQAGYVKEAENAKFIADLPTFSLPEYKFKVGTHRAFAVAGDSMENTLFEGDKVIASFLEPSLWESGIKDNYVHVIVTKSDILVRRAINKIKEESIIEIVSDNEFYDPIRLETQHIREMWYVRAKISPFLPSPRNISNLLRNEMAELRGVIKEQSHLIGELSRKMG